MAWMKNIILKEPFMFQLQRDDDMFYVEEVDVLRGGSWQQENDCLSLLRSRSEAIFEEWSNLVFVWCVNCFNC